MVRKYVFMKGKLMLLQQLMEASDPDWDNLRIKIDDAYDYSKSEDENDGVEYTLRLTAINSKGQVGYIEWDREGGEIEKIYVGDGYRRQGVATHLWDEAHDYVKEIHAKYPDAVIVEPEHSSRRSQAGDAWANSVGGHVPDLDDDIDGWSSR